MSNGQMLGILLGGIAGYTLSQLDVFRHKSFGPLYVGGATLAGGFFGSVIGKGFDTSAQLPPSTTFTPAPVPVPTPAAPRNIGANFFTLIPNQPVALSQPIRLDETVTIQLPAGAMWLPGGQNPAAGNLPMTWTYTGPGTISLQWEATDGSTQQTTMTFYTTS
jgi:hypothetical protein